MVSYQSNFYWLRSMYPGGKWMVSLVPKLWLVKIDISWRQMSGQLLSLIWLVKWKCKWNVIGQISWSRKMKVLSYWSKYVWSVKVGENKKKGSRGKVKWKGYFKGTDEILLVKIPQIFNLERIRIHTTRRWRIFTRIFQLQFSIDI